MTAKRINSSEELDDTILSYWKEDGIWWLYFPGCGLGNLSNHKIIEHEDGTISVTPSILTEGHDNGVRTQRHGYLEGGIWREV